MAYAERTNVSVEKTEAEIKGLLRKQAHGFVPRNAPVPYPEGDCR